MKYARTKERIFICKFPENCRTIKDNEIIAKADTIEELVQSGDIVFYYDFHSQQEQCLYVKDFDVMFVKDMNITRLLIPVDNDYRQVAKAEHLYQQFNGMKQVIEKGEMELL